ncbi:MAG TPA: hypothetical protein VGA22_03240 [Gemmatimonadales bacterium]
MKRWQWWALIAFAVVLIVATFAANRYTMQCVTPQFGPRDAAVVCHILDRWTGEVSRH